MSVLVSNDGRRSRSCWVSEQIVHWKGNRKILSKSDKDVEHWSKMSSTWVADGLRLAFMAVHVGGDDSAVQVHGNIPREPGVGVSRDLHRSRGIRGTQAALDGHDVHVEHQCGLYASL